VFGHSLDRKFLGPDSSPKVLLDQQAAAQADGIAAMPSGSAVQIAGTILSAPGDVRGYVQLPNRAHKILAVIDLVCTHDDAAVTSLLLLTLVEAFIRNTSRFGSFLRCTWMIDSRLALIDERFALGA
jgi:hypothetical protein